MYLDAESARVEQWRKHNNTSLPDNTANPPSLEGETISGNHTMQQWWLDVQPKSLQRQTVWATTNVTTV